jgi:hypothetical protein
MGNKLYVGNLAYSACGTSRFNAAFSAIRHMWHVGQGHDGP